MNEKQERDLLQGFVSVAELLVEILTALVEIRDELRRANTLASKPVQK